MTYQYEIKHSKIDHPMSYWNSPDGIQGTSLEGVATETKKCECGCDVYFDADQTIVHRVTSAIISFDCLDSYDELLEKERIENL